MILVRDKFDNRPPKGPTNDPKHVTGWWWVCTCGVWGYYVDSLPDEFKVVCNVNPYIHDQLTHMTPLDPTLSAALSAAYLLNGEAGLVPFCDMEVT